MKKILNKNIEELELNSSLVIKLKNSNINKIYDLWILNRKELKNKGLNDSEITQIIVQLQLNALDLNRKIY